MDAPRLPVVLVVSNTPCFLSVPLSRTRHAVLASEPHCYFRCLSRRRGTAPLRPRLPARPLAGRFLPCWAGSIPTSRPSSGDLGFAHAPSWVRVGMLPLWRHGWLSSGGFSGGDVLREGFVVRIKGLNVRDASKTQINGKEVGISLRNTKSDGGGAGLAVIPGVGSAPAMGKRGAHPKSSP